MDFKGHVKPPTFWKIFGLRQKFDASGFFFKIQNFMWEKTVTGGISGLSITKDFDIKNFGLVGLE